MLLNFLRPYILAFIPIFIAIDVIGNIPLFLSLTEKFSHKQRKKIIRESIFYAFIMTALFITGGKFILQTVGITIADFKIAGGILILVFSITLLLTKHIQFLYDDKKTSQLGVFPLATPLLAGPALLTISLNILQEFGIFITLTSLILNMLLTWLVLEKCDVINKFIGERGVKSFSKIFEILLASFGIMMIRQGVIEIFFK